MAPRIGFYFLKVSIVLRVIKSVAAQVIINIIIISVGVLFVSYNWHKEETSTLKKKKKKRKRKISALKYSTCVSSWFPVEQCNYSTPRQ